MTFAYTDADYFKEWCRRCYNAAVGIAISELLTICLVGSHQSAASFAAVNDVDFLLVFRRFGVAEFDTLLSHFRAAANLLSTKEVTCFVETPSGPLKPDLPPPGLCYVQLHIIPYGLDDWIKALRYPGCRKWINQNVHIAGLPLCSLSQEPAVSDESLRRDISVLRMNVISRTAYTIHGVLNDCA